MCAMEDLLSGPGSYPFEKDIVSPLVSPPASEGGTLQHAITWNTNNKQWTDLETLSPKLLSELRRQYEPPIQDEPNGSVAKGAAKLKAWARHSKKGIDFRLRRKINAERDQVVDFRLVSDASHADIRQENEKPLLVSELSDTHGISEMPDTSVPLELDSHSLVSEHNAKAHQQEPLPKYEPRSETTNRARPAAREVFESRASYEKGSAVPSGLNHHSDPISSSAAALISMESSTLEAQGSLESSEANEKEQQERKSTTEARTAEDQAPENACTQHVGLPRLDNDARVSESIKIILQALKEENGPKSVPTSPHGYDRKRIATGPESRDLVVERATSYETETDAEPVSSKPYRSPRRSLKKPEGRMRRQKTASRSVSFRSTTEEGGSVSDDGAGANELALVRKQTLPKRVVANAGPQAIWKSLLRSQAMLLGSAHPLVYQAKSDLAHGRANNHAAGSVKLKSLRDSEAIATSTLGTAHPWVSAFAEDLAALAKLIEPATEVTTKAQIDQSKDKQGAEMGEGEDPALQDGSLSQAHNAEHPSVVDEGNPSLRQISRDAVIPTIAQRPNQSISTAPSSRESQTFLPKITTTFHTDQEDFRFVDSQKSGQDAFRTPWLSSRPEPRTHHEPFIVSKLILVALTNVAVRGLTWLQRNLGPEQPVEAGKVRVRWTCSCGVDLYDDFIERRPGAARLLEAYLNKPKTHGTGNTPTSPGSSRGTLGWGNNSPTDGIPSSHTSWSSYGQGSLGNSNGRDSKLRTYAGMNLFPAYEPSPEPPWLLTCAPEEKNTPKLTHLDMSPHKIRNDKDLALSLRSHYFRRVNRKWWRALRLRGLTTIEFVQFEVHRNRFADIRKCPDMPDTSSVDYAFEPSDLLPPVGSQYLLHLFRHPEDYDAELITYCRAPKRLQQLAQGPGWGINLVEGFLAHRVWMLVSGFFSFASLVFVVAWACKREDVQGASGVAAWIVSLSLLVVGWFQAFLG